jgi:type I restriction enzyme R subunit
MYEPAMRHLIDTFIQAEPSEKVSAFDDLGLVKLIVERGVPGLKALPPGLRSDPGTMGETIENNIRKLIVDKHPINPRYYSDMSALLDALIEERRSAAITYRAYLAKVVQLARDLDAGPKATAYPALIDTPAKRAIFDNTGRHESRALAIDAAIRAKIQDGWRDSPIKAGRVRRALAGVIGPDEKQIDAVMDLAKTQHDY